MENSRGKKLIQLVKLQNLKEQHEEPQYFVNPREFSIDNLRPNRGLLATDLENSTDEEIRENVNTTTLTTQDLVNPTEFSIDNIPPNGGLSATDLENNNEEEFRENVNTRYEESNGESDVEPYEDSGSEWHPSGSEEGVTESTAGVSDLEAVTEDNRETDSNVEGSEGRKKRGRKRRILNQSREERKRMANSNLKYVSARNKIIEPKKFNANYLCTCLKKCHTLVDAEMRKILFEQFWSIGTFEGRCVMLSKCVKEIDKKRCYIKHKVSRRNKTRIYHINDVQVCKNMFLSTLQINQNRITVALLKMQDNVIQDKRGQNSGGRNATDDNRIKSIKQHISSFPHYVSHYCRSQTESKFLNPELNLAAMYKLYKNTTEQPVSLSKYKGVFYSNFNLKFKVPHKDTCKTCDTYFAQSSSVKDIIQKENLDTHHTKHIQIADELRNQMKADLKAAKDDETLETLTFDLQKTHPLPKLPTGIVYYKRQLNLFNLGINVGSTGRGIFNVWLEYEAGRGTQEIGSCLRKYINDNVQAPVKNLILWSDSCGGQNRSIKLVLMLINLLQNHASLESISLNFLLSGHSFLPNDSHFGDVECALKTQQRLYTDSDYIEVMKNCRRKNKFIVNRIRSEDMVSVKMMEKSITNRKYDSNKENINWLQTHVITIKKESPTILYMKKHVTDSIFSEVSIEKAGKGRKAILKHIELPPLWPNGKALADDKINDLKEILKLIPNDAQPFYNFFKNVEGEEFEEDLDGLGPNLDFEIDQDQLDDPVD